MGMERHSFLDKRTDDRVPVLHRTKAVGPEGHSLALVIVDLSAGGMMARCDLGFVPGVLIQVALPVIGVHPVQVRWSLGGRIGCEFCPALAGDQYAAVLAAVTR